MVRSSDPQLPPSAPQALVVIGGGAAGMFGAIRAAELLPRGQVTLLEAGQRLLTKVLASGGGRCNVTHACFDPAVLVTHYPRGAKELRGAFTRFQPRDTVAWFEARGVKLKTEADGRMFPVTDDAATIASCLEEAARAAGVQIRRGARVEQISRDESGAFVIALRGGDRIVARRLLLATGSAPAGHELAASLGVPLVAAVPSLFTFKVQDPRLTDLAGLSLAEVEASLTTPGQKRPLTRRGPWLITHWGMSGPAILRLSAFGARDLHASGYQADLRLNLLAGLAPAAAAEQLERYRTAHPKQWVAVHSPWPELPRRLWQRLVDAAGIAADAPYAGLSRAAAQALVTEMTGGRYAVVGKGAFKEEFVTAGGVSLTDVDFGRMESRSCPGLHLAGEVLDIDGVTGGFNFQNAWTTAWIAAEAIAAAATN